MLNKLKNYFKENAAMIAAGLAAMNGSYYPPYAL